MTEQEWESATRHGDLGQALEELDALSSWRKRVLLSCTCCRLALANSRDPGGLMAETVAFVEAAADTGPIREEVWKVRNRPLRKIEKTGRVRRELMDAVGKLLRLATHYNPETDQFAVWSVLWDTRRRSQKVKDRGHQGKLIHDIFGNPFHPVTFDTCWRTFDAVGLARAIYEDKAFERLPILADALMDAGCANEQILGHCRSDGPHVRGCWVVDKILEKE